MIDFAAAKTAGGAINKSISLQDRSVQDRPVQDRPVRGGKPETFFEILSKIEADYAAARSGLRGALGGNTESARLLKTQMLVSDLNLKVECVAKAADGALSLTRRLQGA